MYLDCNDLMWLYNFMAIDRSKNTQKIFTISKDMADELSEYRHGRRISSEAEAIRQLLRIALDVEKKEDSGS